MPSINKCIFIGNLGRDPEMRYTPNGIAVTEFSLAVNENYQKEGEWVQDTTWINAIVWGEAAERAAENLRKGNLVYIEGRYKDDTWEDKETGKKMHRAKFVVNLFRNLTSKEERENGGSGNPNLDFAEREVERRGVGASASAQRRPVDDIDDLPF